MNSPSTGLSPVSYTHLVFTLTADEMIFGCGESATGLNKVGQKVNLFVTDPQEMCIRDSNMICLSVKY